MLYLYIIIICLIEPTLSYFSYVFYFSDSSTSLLELRADHALQLRAELVPPVRVRGPVPEPLLRDDLLKHGFNAITMN